MQKTGASILITIMGASLLVWFLVVVNGENELDYFNPKYHDYLGADGNGWHVSDKEDPYGPYKPMPDIVRCPLNASDVHSALAMIGQKVHPTRPVVWDTRLFIRGEMILFGNTGNQFIAKRRGSYYLLHGNYLPWVQKKHSSCEFATVRRQE